ncbi:hypothetical protein Angca_001728 [Angiostrongylus cantonensis]|nr:hypothetical protein Angca_001728 [Angiostrongylus cantonensis]
MSRWENLPISEHQSKYLASETTTTPHPSQHVNSRLLGSLIRQDITEAGQKICYYRSGLVSTDFPIPYMCQMGCCDRGCCTVADLAVNSSSISWTIALLTTVLVTALLASVAIFVVYLMNRRKDSILKKQIVYGGESPTASQISGNAVYIHRDSHLDEHGIKLY